MYPAALLSEGCHAAAEEKQLVMARLAEKQKEALAKKAEEAQMKLLEEERTREERRQVGHPLSARLVLQDRTGPVITSANMHLLN
jgi:indole-3-glycerol phosphate synthase